MSTGWNRNSGESNAREIINLLGNEYWLELWVFVFARHENYKPTGK